MRIRIGAIGIQEKIINLEFIAIFIGDIANFAVAFVRLGVHAAEIINFATKKKSISLSSLKRNVFSCLRWQRTNKIDDACNLCKTHVFQAYVNRRVYQDRLKQHFYATKLCLYGLKLRKVDFSDLLVI